MSILLSILAFSAVSFLVYISFSMLSGYRIALYLNMFDRSYNGIFAETGSKAMALHTALTELKKGPRFGQLTAEEIELIVSKLSRLPDPKKIINKVVLQMDSKEAVRALKNRDFLEEIVSIYSERHSQDSVAQAEQETKEDKAENLVDSCRTLLGVIQPNLYRQFPEILTLVDDTNITFYGTIAFVWTACARLHFDVDAKERTPLEMIVKEQLREWHPDAISEYEDIHNFISKQILREPDRQKRGTLLFESAGKWVVSKITNEEDVKGKGVEIAETLSKLFLQETSGYWKR